MVIANLLTLWVEELFLLHNSSWMELPLKVIDTQHKWDQPESFSGINIIPEGRGSLLFPLRPPSGVWSNVKPGAMNNPGTRRNLVLAEGKEDTYREKQKQDRQTDTHTHTQKKRNRLSDNVA